jgi:outer membrane protein assembly factor BamE (lipoprotein component of BamABCDE complex)
MNRSCVLLLVSALWLLTACASWHAADVQEGMKGDKLTLGTVQREIKVGMTGAQVVEVLGSPNVVTTDEQRREVWVYDKIATDVVHSTSSSLVLGGAFGSSGGGGGLIGQNAGATSTSQRTLTVIIKFDEQSKVRDFAYRSTRF